MSRKEPIKLLKMIKDHANYEFIGNDKINYEDTDDISRLHDLTFNSDVTTRFINKYKEEKMKARYKKC